MYADGTTPTTADLLTMKTRLNTAIDNIINKHVH